MNQNDCSGRACRQADNDSIKYVSKHLLSKLISLPNFNIKNISVL